ncbi:hypothetical protein MRX96_003819 [Rhipicephalus microplus]
MYTSRVKTERGGPDGPWSDKCVVDKCRRIRARTRSTASQGQQRSFRRLAKRDHSISAVGKWLINGRWESRAAPLCTHARPAAATAAASLREIVLAGWPVRCRCHLMIASRAREPGQTARFVKGKKGEEVSFSAAITVMVAGHGTRQMDK